MPNPVVLNAPSAQRSGTTTIGPVAYAGGYATWSGTLTGLGSGPGSDYENPANVLDIGIYNEDPNSPGTYILFDGFQWKGGPRTLHGVTDPPPPFSFGIANLPVGNIKVVFTLTGTYTVGLASTLS